MAFVTSEFGPRKRPCPTCSDDHKGIDFRAPVGSPIYANQDLKITRVKDFGNAGYGKALYVKDPNDPTKEYIYGHLDDNNPGGYKEGDIIPQGALMAYTGRTGANDEPHLHYEVRQNGVPIPPRPHTSVSSFSKDKGNLLTEDAVPLKNRPSKPAQQPVAPGKTLPELEAARQREKNKTGPGSNPRPRPEKADVGIVVNPRHNHGD
jgi:murein DD-endopeptidase MepM/ murein hydrolase activator NlpD